MVTNELNTHKHLSLTNKFFHYHKKTIQCLPTKRIPLTTSVCGRWLKICRKISLEKEMGRLLMVTYLEEKENGFEFDLQGCVSCVLTRYVLPEL